MFPQPANGTHSAPSRQVERAAGFGVAPGGDAERGSSGPRDNREARIAPRSSRLRILLAEDDDEMRRIVAEALRADGYEVVELIDGGRLLVDIARRLKSGTGANSMDLIVSDIRMPVCTGLQIVSALRDAHWHTPVILMTAFGDAATRKHAETLQAVLFDKPFDIDDLRKVVASMLPHG